MAAWLDTIRRYRTRDQRDLSSGDFEWPREKRKSDDAVANISAKAADASRAYRPIDEHLMPQPAFAHIKDADNLGLGVRRDRGAYLAEIRQTLDFNLKRLAYRARNGKLQGVRLVAGKLAVTPLSNEVPAEAEELNWELNSMYPLVEVPDLLTDAHSSTGFADQFAHVRMSDPPRSVPAMLAGVLPDATNRADGHGHRLQGYARASTTGSAP